MSRRCSSLCLILLLTSGLIACGGDDTTNPLIGDAGTDTGAKDANADGPLHDGSTSDAAPHDAAADAGLPSNDGASADSPNDG